MLTGLEGSRTSKTQLCLTWSAQLSAIPSSATPSSSRAGRGSAVWVPPPFGGGTHTALPLPARELLGVADEGIADNCADQVKHSWVFDVREPSNPVSIATLPTPSEVDYCAKGGHFGPHNLHENRPGSFVSDRLVFATYQNAGVRVYDLADPFAPREVGAFVPPAPERLYDTRPDRPRVIQSCDVFVDRDAVMYVTDYNAGLYVLQYEPSSS